MSIHSVVTVSNNTKDSNDSKRGHEEDDYRIAHPMGNQAPNQMHNVVTNTLAIKGQAGQQQGRGDDDNNNNNNVKWGKLINAKKQHQGDSRVSLFGTSIKGREFEDPFTKAQMKAMAARALWQLSRGNLAICRNITESKALLCFADLLEKGPEDVQSYSAMALMEITAVAEQQADLRRSAFKPTSPAAKAVVDQLIIVIENGDSDLLIPCVRAIGNLARTVRATETRIIGPLVSLLDEREAEVSMEAAIALNKFACTGNFLHENHGNAIIVAGGAKHLVQLVFFGEQMVQIPSVTFIVLHSITRPHERYACARRGAHST